MLNRAIVREGKPYPPATVEELEINPEAPAALTKLKAAGFLLPVVTNQPDAARGTQTIENIDAINAHLSAALPLDGVYVCFHAQDGQCDCRKPQPGLLLRAAREQNIALDRSYLIGDRRNDVDAGKSAGVRVAFIDYGYGEPPPRHSPDATVASLHEAVAWILNGEAS